MSRPTPAVNRLPVSVILLFLPIVGFEGYIAGAEAGLWGSFSARLDMIRSFAMIPELVELVAARGLWSLETLLPFAVHPFVHGTFLTATFGAVFVLALGKFVGEAMGDFAVIVVFFASAVIGALAYITFLPDTYPVFGAYPGAYGLIGAFTYIRFSDARGLKAEQMRAFQLLGVLMGLNLGFALLFGGPNTWFTELVGALTGFIVAAGLQPGGIPHLIATIRGR